MHNQAISETHKRLLAVSHDPSPDVEALCTHKALLVWLEENRLQNQIFSESDIIVLDGFWNLLRDHGIDLSIEEKRRVSRHYFNTKG